MKDENCIFCKLANGDIPTKTVYEDEEFRVIFDASPATLGHALILPKSHAADVYEIDEALFGRAMKLAKKMAAVMTEVFCADGFNILQNNGEAAGQTVFHLHIHLIPRYKGKNDLLMWKPGTQDEAALDAAIEKLQKMLK